MSATTATAPYENFMTQTEETLAQEIARLKAENTRLSLCVDKHAEALITAQEVLAAIHADQLAPAYRDAFEAARANFQTLYDAVERDHSGYFCEVASLETLNTLNTAGRARAERAAQGLQLERDFFKLSDELGTAVIANMREALEALPPTAIVENALLYADCVALDLQEARRKHDIAAKGLELVQLERPDHQPEGTAEERFIIVTTSPTDTVLDLRLSDPAGCLLYHSRVKIHATQL